MTQSANNQKASVGAAIDTVLKNFNALPGSQRQDYLSGLAVASLGVMRAMHGKEFVRGYLMAAIADLENPPMLQPMPVH